MITSKKSMHTILISLLFLPCGQSFGQSESTVAAPVKEGSIQDSLFKQALVRAFGPSAAALSETQQSLLKYTAAAAAAYLFISLMRQRNQKQQATPAMTKSTASSSSMSSTRIDTPTSGHIETPSAVSIASTPRQNDLDLSRMEIAEIITLGTSFILQELQRLTQEIRDLEGRVMAINIEPPTQTDDPREHGLADKRQFDLQVAYQRKKALEKELQKRRQTTPVEKQSPPPVLSFIQSLNFTGSSSSLTGSPLYTDRTEAEKKSEAELPAMTESSTTKIETEMPD